MKKPLELYLHIPFCQRKCNYCDFLSFPAPMPQQERYLSALLREVEARAAACRDYEVVSLFLGGGTPSVVSPLWIGRLMDAVRGSYICADGMEATIEVNPGTVDLSKLTAYRLAGLNRVSIGMQSASDEELARLGRIHTWGQFLEAYQAARDAGFANVNVDVMSALPGQTPSSYDRTLQSLLSLDPVPEHISAYSLIVEDGTPFAALRDAGRLPLPDEDQEREMYYHTREALEAAGYRRYEISNYARPGYACRHNCGYWVRTPYLGFGLGAASLFEEARFSNTRDFSAYCENPLDCRVDIHPLSRKERMEEFLFLGLRLTDGVMDDRFREEFGKGLMQVYGPVIDRNGKDGLLCWEAGRLRLTDRGVDVSNYVSAQFLLD